MTVKWFGADAVEAMLAAQGVAVAPGRGARLARGLEASIGPSIEEAARGGLELEGEPCGFALALERCKTR
jgi:hypothetical protein